VSTVGIEGRERLPGIWSRRIPRREYGSAEYSERGGYVSIATERNDNDRPSSSPAPIPESCYRARAFNADVQGPRPAMAERLGDGGTGADRLKLAKWRLAGL